MTNESDDAVTGEHPVLEMPEAKTPADYLTYADNPEPEVIWRCGLGHELGIKGAHTPPSVKFSAGDGTWIDSGPVCFECMSNVLRENFKMEMVVPEPAPEEKGDG